MHRYPGMTTDSLCSFLTDNNIEVAENAACFMWGLWPYRSVKGETDLRDAFRVLESWGFKYKSLAFIWIKLNKVGPGYFFGPGHYTASNSEPCLLGIRGKMPVKSNYVSQLIIARRQEHSKKPPTVRDKIVELFGDLPRLEIFARDRTPGWDVIGNQLPEE